MDTKKEPKRAEKYVCELCVFECSKKSGWDRHILTAKHINNVENDTNDTKKGQKGRIEEYICDCGKKYNYKSGLWRHKRICEKKVSNIVVDTSSNEIKILSGLVLELVKSSNDLQKQMIDVCAKIQQGNNITNSNNITNNKTFNINLFLNEECKDAMNMSEFINSIVLKMSDLENFGKNGYVEGMSTIIINKLQDIDIKKRPVHCSDAKRETLYIKEENKWEKDTKKMVKAVRCVDKKNYELLATWKDEHPKCNDINSIQSDEYINVVSKVMDGDEEKINKVIKRVAKQVVIEK